MFSLRVAPSRSPYDKKYLNFISLSALLLASYLTLFSLPLPRPPALLSFSFLLFILLSPPLLTSTVHPFPEPGPPSPLLGPHPGQPEPTPRQTTLAEAARTPEFWLLCFTMGCGMGSGLTTINNISQMGESLGYPRSRISTLVSLWGICNFLGRLGSGYGSDLLVSRGGVPRPVCISMAILLMGLGHVVVALGFTGNLYLGSIVIGVCYGSLWSLMPTVCGEVFGVRHVGAIFNTVAIASPVGSYLFSVWVVGRIHDGEVLGPGGSCSGTHCFMLSFAILACVCVLGFAASIALFFQTRDFYWWILTRVGPA